MRTESINARGARDLAHIGDVSEMSQQMRFRSVYADTLREMFAGDPAVARTVMEEHCDGTAELLRGLLG